MGSMLGVISMVFFINKTICLHWILLRQGGRQRELPADIALCWIAGNRFGWLGRQQRRIFPGEFEPVGWAGRSGGSQYVVGHEDDAHRVAPREDCVNRQMKNILWD